MKNRLIAGYPKGKPFIEICKNLAKGASEGAKDKCTPIEKIIGGTQGFLKAAKREIEDSVIIG